MVDAFKLVKQGVQQMYPFRERIHQVPSNRGANRDDRFTIENVATVQTVTYIAVSS